MASAPANLPLFYTDLMPLSSRDHGDWRARSTDRAPWLAKQHAVPLTAEEFVQAGRHYPIVFSAGDDPVPLALMGLNEGVNTFVDAEGLVAEPVYIPAYVRRYPFLLARLSQESDELSLCFDPTSDLVGPFDDGQPLFDGDQPSEHTRALLDFCGKFEEAGQRTQAMVKELQDAGLLMEGEASIAKNEDPDHPFVYRGFQMINGEKLREMRGDILRKWNQSGLLGLVFAQVFSMNLMSEIFGRQIQQGTAPQPDAGTAGLGASSPN